MFLEGGSRLLEGGMMPLEGVITGTVGCMMTF